MTRVRIEPRRERRLWRTVGWPVAVTLTLTAVLTAMLLLYEAMTAGAQQPPEAVRAADCAPINVIAADLATGTFPTRPTGEYNLMVRHMGPQSRAGWRAAALHRPAVRGCDTLPACRRCSSSSSPSSTTARPSSACTPPGRSGRTTPTTTR